MLGLADHDDPCSQILAAMRVKQHHLTVFQSGLVKTLVRCTLQPKSALPSAISRKSHFGPEYVQHLLVVSPKRPDLGLSFHA